MRSMVEGYSPIESAIPVHRTSSTARFASRLRCCDVPPAHRSSQLRPPPPLGEDLVGDPLISLRAITKSFGTGQAAFQALKGVDLDIMPGDFVAVMGPSGSGKSTTMNILGCLDVPTSGVFLFHGRHIEQLTRDQRSLLRRRYLGFVFQGFNLLARTTALENVELPLIYRGLPKEKRQEAAMAALEKVGLAQWADHTPGELSGGQQQRVAIARAIVTEPDVLLADEPTGNLDTERSIEIMELLTDLNLRSGITVLMVTHESEMADFARTIIHFRDGLVEGVETGHKRAAGRKAHLPASSPEGEGEG